MEETDLTQHEPNNYTLPWAVGEAAKRGDLQAVKAWLAKPVSDIDAMDNCQWTLLHHTCLANPLTADSVALAKYLLSRGASVNHGDASVLHCAVARPSTRYSTDMIGLLLRAGADVDARDMDGESPIAWAIKSFSRSNGVSESERTRALECTVQLLRYGASLADRFFGLESDTLEDFIDEQNYYSLDDLTSNKQFLDCQAILAGVKTAGSWRAFRDDPANPWRAYERVPRKAVLRLRSLVARKRATTTNPLFNALFASPNEIVWHVLGFWRARIPSS